MRLTRKDLRKIILQEIGYGGGYMDQQGQSSEFSMNQHNAVLKSSGMQSRAVPVNDGSDFESIGDFQIKVIPRGKEQEVISYLESAQSELINAEGQTDNVADYLYTILRPGKIKVNIQYK